MQKSTQTHSDCTECPTSSHKQFIECLPLFVHMFWESHAIVQSYARSYLLIRSSACVQMCVCVQQGQAGETVGINDQHTYCYLFLMELLNLKMVHRITNSYKENSINLLHIKQKTNKDRESYFIESTYEQHTSSFSNRLQIMLVSSYRNTKTH